MKRRSSATRTCEHQISELTVSSRNRIRHLLTSTLDSIWRRGCYRHSGLVVYSVHTSSELPRQLSWYNIGGAGRGGVGCGGTAGTMLTQTLTITFTPKVNMAIAVRRWQKSRRIYVRPRTGPRSAHLWWPAVVKLQAASVPIGQTDGRIALFQNAP